MALDYASIIRGGAALLYAFVGLFLIARRPTSRAVLAFGWLYLVVALPTVYNNVRFLVSGPGLLRTSELWTFSAFLLALLAVSTRLATLVWPDLPSNARRFVLIFGIACVALILWLVPA